MTESPLQVTSITCEPFTDQRPGTAGLRKKVSVFRQPHYLETFSEAVFRAAALPDGATLVIGGDGRFHNDRAIQSIAALAAARGVARLVIGQHGLLSTPAASHLIRKLGADGGFILTASHNPGGPDGDFGIKFNIANGGQAPESLTEAIYAHSREVTGYRLARLPQFDLGRTGRLAFGPMTIDIVDPADDYAQLMQELFDFDAIAAGLRAGRRVCFDAMHGVTGPYARRIFGDLLGLPAGLLLRADPLPDFGGLHPDPNPVDAAELVRLANSPGAPDLLAASDGDGDRNMILGPGCFVSPGDSIAVMLAQHRQVPGYAGGVPGVARSMPTSRAVDAVAAALGLPCYETPTGWRFFCNLLEAGRIGLCGEESFGTSSAHVREKDGIWAVLFWLSLLTTLRQSVPQILDAHWRQYGRHYYQRQDFQIDDVASAGRLVDALRDALPRLGGTAAGGSRIMLADDFTYLDPVDGSESRHQGIRLLLEDGSRIVYRLSGTGTAGATLRVYLERHVCDPGALHGAPGPVLADLASQALAIARLEELTGVNRPSYVI
jgi:phosphoglucomutase